jgi:kinetochore-associated protein 1
MLHGARCGMLALQLVYKVKSNDMLEKLALISSDKSEQSKWQQLVDEAKENLCKIQVCLPSCHMGVSGDVLSNIIIGPNNPIVLTCLCLVYFQQDDDFVVNFCLKAQWVTYETTQEMLSYAKTRVSYFTLGKICFSHS